MSDHSCHHHDHRAPPAAVTDDPGALYTCPMHPDVRQVGPGTCPECGMALEPVAPGEAADDGELRDMTRRLLVSAVLTAPILLLSMGPLMHVAHRRWYELALATPVVLWGSWPLMVRCVESIRRLRPNMFTLIGMGVSIAYAYSVLAVVAPGLFPAGFRDANGEVGVYFEAAAVIVTLALLGQVLELRARQATGSALRELLNLAPATARRVREGGDDEEVPVSAVVPGDRLRVRPGDKVPLDGLIVEGETRIDESMLTGEPVPVRKGPGDRVIGGTINRGSGALVIEVEKVGEDTVLARIVALVAHAQRSRAPIQRLADQVAAWFVPAVLVSAVVTFFVWAWFGPQPRLAYGLVNAVAVLIIACPCALGLATPMSVTVATGRAAQLGVLFRDAEAIERLHDADTLVVDKTGTLTLGRPEVIEVIAAPPHDERELLRLAAAVETGSEHPLASAVIAAARERGAPSAPATDFAAVAGKGVTATVDGHRVALGKDALMADEGAGLDEALRQSAERLRAKGATIVFVAVDGAAAGLLAIADPVRETTPAALHELRASGLRIIMLTGDNETTARAVAASLEIDEVIAEAMPEDKLATVERLQAAGAKVAMAGDGINDAPALAAAYVGIAMGTGTDVAMESAAVTLIKGDLGALARARRLAELTMANIRQNLWFAFGYNAIGVPVAAGVLYPFTGLLLSPAFAAAAMSLSSVSVIANALRLRARS